MFVRSFVCAFAMKCMPQSLKTFWWTLVGVNHNRSEYSYICMLTRYVRRSIFIRIMIVFEQTVTPRSANLCRYMHVDKVPSLANFHPNPQRLWCSFSTSKNMNCLAIAAKRLYLTSTAWPVSIPIAKCQEVSGHLIKW